MPAEGPDTAGRRPSRAVVVASLGDYRLRPMQLLKERLGDDLLLAAGVSAYDRSIVTLTSLDVDMRELRNHYGPRHVLWQSVPWWQLMRLESLVLDLNPRAIHVWLLVVGRRVLRRRTGLWGHAWSTGGRSGPGERARDLLRRQATCLVAYGEAEAGELRVRHPQREVVAAPNALYFRREQRHAAGRVRFRMLYVGRLVEAKKVQLLVTAFLGLAADLAGPTLTLVGSGPLRSTLEAQVAMSPHRSRVEFLGHVSSYAELAELYDEAVVTVSPGYVGLSAIQTFGFGVPMLISRDERHSPEIGAATEGTNCEYFDTDDGTSLRHGLEGFWRLRERWDRRGTEIAEVCARDYSVERMVQGLEAALGSGQPR